MKSLPDHFYTMPFNANTTMTKKDLQELLLATDGRAFSCGYMWRIHSEKIGPNIYRVKLVKD